MFPSEKPKFNLNLTGIFSLWYNVRSPDFIFKNLPVFMSCFYRKFLYQTILINNFKTNISAYSEYHLAPLHIDLNFIFTPKKKRQHSYA